MSERMTKQNSAKTERSIKDFLWFHFFITQRYQINLQAKVFSLQLIKSLRLHELSFAFLSTILCKLNPVQSLNNHILCFISLSFQMCANNRTRRKWNQVLLFLVSCHFVKYSISSPIFSSQFSQCEYLSEERRESKKRQK